MKEYLLRALSGAVYISVVVLCMFASREWFIGLFFILGVITIYEFLKLIDLKSIIPYLLFGLAIYFLSYRVYNDNAITLLVIISCFVNLFLCNDILWVQKKPILKNIKYPTVIFYLIGGFVCLTLIPFNNKTFTPSTIIGVFALIWANDTMAYLIGKNFGKRKLLERISPKKTIEGFLGGIFGALIAAFVIASISQPYSLWMWITMGVIASLFGTIGDLVQSKFKRKAGVKDSGAIMPGHGGIYDRLDSIIYTSPFIFAFIQITDYVS